MSWRDFPPGAAPGLRGRVERKRHHVARKAADRRRQRRNFHGRHRFIDRSDGAEHLVLVIAGHKRDLWPITLARLERFVPPGADVCVVSPGVESAELDAIAERAGWSRLSTHANQLSLGQNLGLRAHPGARYVTRLDEDIVVGDGFFDALLDGYDAIAAEGRFRPGFVAPVINVNGFSYRVFLETLGLADEYRARFGSVPQACHDIPAHSDGEAALWLWEHSLPFDEIAERFRAEPFGYTPVPQRFSIGAIHFERSLWAEFGGYPVTAAIGMGDDEETICKECTDRSRLMAVLHNVLAGHVSFGPQATVMSANLPRLAAGLAMAPQRRALSA